MFCWVLPIGPAIVLFCSVLPCLQDKFYCLDLSRLLLSCLVWLGPVRFVQRSNCYSRLSESIAPHKSPVNLVLFCWVLPFWSCHLSCPVLFCLVFKIIVLSRLVLSC